MTPYHQIKLWNKLSFSEDYVIGVMNTKKFYRQDLALRVTEALHKIKGDYLEYCEEELVKLQGRDPHLTMTNKKTMSI